MEIIYKTYKDELVKYPFLVILGKYDQILGPRALYSSIEIKDEEFIRNLLRDALNTKNKFVILDFQKFYAQVCKIDVEDKSARGGKQLYAIILLRHEEYPLIPILHFKKIEMMFHRIGNERILADDLNGFKAFIDEVEEIYIKKDAVLPLESINLQIRSGINTIQGFCELILEEKRKQGKLSEENVLSYVKLMLDSCNDIIKALEGEEFNNSIKK
ncbi:MAG: hypothetical protein ACTSXH_13040 [Promethearchaeota archaeon]